MGWIVECRLRAQFQIDDIDKQWQQLTDGLGSGPVSFDTANEFLKAMAGIRRFEYRAVLVTPEGVRIPELHYTTAVYENR